VGETRHFVNEGFGWECRRCRKASDDAARVDEESPASALPRFFREGEAEAGAARLSTAALARWTDESRTTLRCPACGVEEEFTG
jgi:rubredoxin